MRNIIGIDPGKTGGVAIIYDHMVETEVHPTPETFKERAELLKAHDGGWETIAFIEQVHSIPGTSAKSNFTFGGEYYSWLAILETLGISFETVTPATWQKVMLEGKPKRPDTKKLNILIKEEPCNSPFIKQKKDLLARHKKAIKEYAYTTAHRLYPSVSFLATDRCSVPHDGMVDALLIAEYGRRTAG